MRETETREKKDWLAPVAIVLGASGVFAGLYFWIKKPPKEVEEGEWAKAGVILARKEFKVTITTEQAGWKSANEELARKPFQLTIIEVVPGTWLPANAELAKQNFTATIEEAPGAESPVVNTLPAQNITHQGATTRGQLIDTGYVSNVDVYFQFGKTTNYEMGSTSKARKYSGEEGQNFQADIFELQPNTTYHYRAAVDPVGYAPPEVKTTYGTDMTFTTQAPIQGFSLRIKNYPVPPYEWHWLVIWRGTMNWGPFDLDELWIYTGTMPYTSFKLIMTFLDQNNQLVRLEEITGWIPKSGKQYVYNWSTRQLEEI